MTTPLSHATWKFANRATKSRVNHLGKVRWLVIGIILPENRKIDSFLRKMNSCFLIETKFISKLLEKFRRQNECQEIPRLRLFMIFRNSSFLIIQISDLQIFESSNFDFLNQEVRYTGLRKFRKCRCSYFHGKDFPIFSQGCSQVFLNYSGLIKWRNTGFQDLKHQ